MKNDIKKLAEKAGFTLWVDESWRPTKSIIVLSNDCDSELQRFADLIVADTTDQELTPKKDDSKMEVYVSWLSGKALDWAVEIAKDRTLEDVNYSVFRPESYSTDWSVGGIILEDMIQAGYSVESNYFSCDKRIKVSRHDEGSVVEMQYGKTVLEAAMRCYVVNQLGDSVKIPVAAMIPWEEEVDK